MHAVCGCEHATTRIWRAEDNSVELLLSSHIHMGWGIKLITHQVILPAPDFIFKTSYFEIITNMKNARVFQRSFIGLLSGFTSF